MKKWVNIILFFSIVLSFETDAKSDELKEMSVYARRNLPEKHFFIQGKQLYGGGRAESIGRRHTMEDSSCIIGEFAGKNTQLYGLFDGHGSSEPSIYVAQNIPGIILQKLKEYDGDVKKSLQSSIYEINEYAVSKWKSSGTTAAIVAIVDKKLYTANVGDSRIILIYGDKVERLSFDHKVTDTEERKLVCDRGGVILNNRVNGVLVLSRAIGDGNLSDYISCEPYISESDFDDNSYLIIACDGVWDVMSDEEAAAIFMTTKNPSAAACAIKDEAIKKGSTDNITVMCVSLCPRE